MARVEPSQVEHSRRGLTVWGISCYGRWEVTLESRGKWAALPRGQAGLFGASTILEELCPGGAPRRIAIRPNVRLELRGKGSSPLQRVIRPKPPLNTGRVVVQGVLQVRAPRP